MKYTASIDGDIATITGVDLNTTTSLIITSATNIADELSAIVADPDEADVAKLSYRLTAIANGVRVETDQGRADIPWRNIASIIADLSE